MGTEAASSLFLMCVQVYTYYNMYVNRYTHAYIKFLIAYYEAGTVLSVLCMIFHPHSYYHPYFIDEETKA